MSAAWATFSMRLCRRVPAARASAIGAAGTLFLVVRVFDGFADLFAGRLVDKTNTRWGRFRPYLLFASLPLLLQLLAVAAVARRRARRPSR